MNKLMKDWEQAPLLRASTDVVDTAIQLTNDTHCTIPGFPTRFNVGNIHEIKQLWSLPTED
ncbi:hypothetical protein SAMN04488697_101476 [Pseudomonas sp. 43mfcvi1.1]|uniref:hypothetical protein n=1 Tax=Pseudomonas sp. 43mfcvi1.1 TaxID=1761894 RepID=UPI000D6C3766|nr:hypothetical protein [Pseudomonas sp. 43mfcvi1.1]PWJ41582.1 hypothetical protein ATJ40_101476 [Pseudomonas sp. 43mfcvi1.1]SSB94735.1 hypothetical protein SAMN04488697_101476 [Pseudomonas sp. 43mfcvi1.1]